MGDVRGVDCALTALGHAIGREPLRIYRDMPRDMAVKLPEIGVSAYLPQEISAYLWRGGKNHAAVVYEDSFGVPSHRWGFVSLPEILKHLRLGRRAMLGFCKLASEKGHWIGTDGGTVNNLYAYYRPDACPIEMTLKSFLAESGFDETGYANINGHRVRLDMAILIG